MINNSTIKFDLAGVLLNKLADYVLLVKLRLTSLVVFSAAAGFALASVNFLWIDMLLLMLGGFMVTGASNAINQIIEKDIDKLMSRTSNRPLAAERMTVMEAVLAAGIMGLSGIIVLSYFFNPLAGLLGALSLICYAFIYTPLKRISPVAVFVGAIPGALPPMIGWVCVTGSMGYEALLLFSIQFLWQFPHFWAIAWVLFDDYLKAGIKLLPSTGGKDRVTAIQNIVYILFLIPVSLIPVLLGWGGAVTATVIVAAGLMYLFPALQLYFTLDNKHAKQLMFASFIYLPIILVALLAGKLI